MARQVDKLRQDLEDLEKKLGEGTYLPCTSTGECGSVGDYVSITNFDYRQTTNTKPN